MLDFSFGEILVIAIIAVIFLGPDKLPETFVKIAKFLRAVKKTINDAKDTLDREIHITEMKQDALEYKKKFEDSALKLKNDIIESANLEPTKTALQSELADLKNEVQSLKIADKLNEPLEKSSISFDEIESKGKALQTRLKQNLKPTKKTQDLSDLGESSESKDLRESTKKTAKDSPKKATKKTNKKLDSSDSSKKSANLKIKKATNLKSAKTKKVSSNSAPKKPTKDSPKNSANRAKKSSDSSSKSANPKTKKDSSLSSKKSAKSTKDLTNPKPKKSTTKSTPKPRKTSGVK